MRDWSESTPRDLEHNRLAGGPRKKLVADVRRVLARFGIRPAKTSPAWAAAWEWAHKIGRSYSAFAKNGKVSWPIPSEIASQYVFLILLEMKHSHMLRLPYRAREQMVPSVAQRLAAVGGQLSIACED